MYRKKHAAWLLPLTERCAAEGFQAIAARSLERSKHRLITTVIFASDDLHTDKLVYPNSAPAHLPDFVEPMQAKLIDSMRTGEWIYEIKFDGCRALALRGGSAPVIATSSELNKIRAEDCPFFKKVAHEYLYSFDSDCNRDVIHDYLYDLLRSIVANHSGSVRDFPASCSQQSLGGTQSVS